MGVHFTAALPQHSRRGGSQGCSRGAAPLKWFEVGAHRNTARNGRVHVHHREKPACRHCAQTQAMVIACLLGTDGVAAVTRVAESYRSTCANTQRYVPHAHAHVHTHGRTERVLPVSCLVCVRIQAEFPARRQAWARCQ